MTLAVVFKIAEKINKKVNDLIPVSSNRPDIGHPPQNHSPHNRLFALRLMRIKKHSPLIRRLKRWNLDISTPKNSCDYRRPLPAPPNSTKKSGTLQDWNSYLRTIPARVQSFYHSNGDCITQLEDIESSASNAIRAGIGNCGERAALAFALLLEDTTLLFGRVRIEVLAIYGGGDHAFVVLNRGRDSKIHDVTTWGDNCVICDPWFDKVLSVGQELTQSKMNKGSASFDYIQKWQKNVKQIIELSVGDGHSFHWYRKCRRKGRSSKFGDWHRPEKKRESIPYVDSISKRQRRESYFNQELDARNPSRAC